MRLTSNLWYPGVVSSAARTFCDGHRLIPLLCLAGAWSDENGGGQIILITGESLGELGQPHYFWSHEGKASLISAAHWQAFKQPSVYEYLAYSVVQQTIRIHLDTQCRLLSELLEREVNERGGLFEFMTRRDLMRARLLSAQLGPDMEEKLFNCFGPEYAVDAKRLLSLDWLRSDSVRKNLQRAYSVDLSGGASSPISTMGTMNRLSGMSCPLGRGTRRRAGLISQILVFAPCPPWFGFGPGPSCA